MSNSFEFPGYSKTAATFTPNYEFERGVLTDGGDIFLIKLMRATQPADLPWLITNVMKDDKNLWSYDKSTMIGYGWLADTSYGPVIAFVGSGKSGKVLSIKLFSEILAHPSSIEIKLDAKRQAGEFFGREVVETEMEKKIMRHWYEERRESENIQKEARKQERLEARRKRREAIFSRETVTGYTSDGKKRYGYPVVGDEWQCLDDNTFVMLVDGIEGDKVGNLIESFVVSKTLGGNPKKLHPAPVSATVRPSTVVGQTTAPRAVDEVFIKMESGTFAVKLFNSIDDIRAARKAGLNGGSLVAVKPEGDKVEVLSAHHDKMDTVGIFPFLKL